MSIGDRLGRVLAARRPARPVAVFRIGLGLAALFSGIASARGLRLFQGDSVVPAPPLEWGLPLDSTPRIVGFLAVWVIASVGLIVGYRARICAVVLASGVVLQYPADQNLWPNHQFLLGLPLLLLVFTESDAALSLRWLAEKRPERTVMGWPLVLAQVQLSLVYVYTAVLSGEMLMRSASLPAALETPLFVRAASVGTVATEFFLGAALWIAPLRYWAFLVGFGFHGLIPSMASMGGLIVAGAIMLSVYILFLDVPERSRLVIWDDQCGFCGWWVRHLKRLDWLRLHRFEGSTNDAALAEAGVTREEADEEIQLWDGVRLHGGIDAVREILKNLPVGFLWAQALALPGIRWLGMRAYRAVARRRRCLLPARATPAREQAPRGG
jgi:predicted DCC family thiol-disulfide oxidoreductase YuxK